MHRHDAALSLGPGHDQDQSATPVLARTMADGLRDPALLPVARSEADRLVDFPHFIAAEGFTDFYNFHALLVFSCFWLDLVTFW
jgi:hypothetical protein